MFVSETNPIKGGSKGEMIASLFCNELQNSLAEVDIRNPSHKGRPRKLVPIR